MNRRDLRGLRFGLGLAVGVAALGIAIWIAGPRRMADAILTAQPAALLLALGLVVALTLARGGLWSVLLSGTTRPGLALTAAAATAVGWLAGHLLPLRAGIVVRAGLVARRAGLPLPTVASSLAMERGLDLGVTALVAVSTTFLFGWGTGGPFAPLVVVSLVLLLGLGLVTYFVASEPERAARLSPRRWRPLVARSVQAFHDGFAQVARDPSRLAKAVGWMVLVVIFQIAFLGALVRAFLPTIPISILMIALPWLVVSFYLAFTPSHLGTFEGAFAALFVPLGVPLHDALTAAVLVHGVMIALALLVGGGAWLLIARPASKLPSAAEPLGPPR